MMRVLHTGTIDVNAGGPAMSTYLTLLGLKERDVDAEIFMFPLSHTGKLRGTEVTVHYASKAVENKFLYSPSYKKELCALGEYDIYHAQGIWQYPTYALADIARRKKKPYLITPRGMLYPQDIAKSNALLKKLSLKLRLLHDFNRAACTHVTCAEEMRHCRNLGITSPIAVIPNPVEIKEYTPHQNDSVFRLGYLGRLSPRKNVEGLIRAFAMLGNIVQNAELLIIGGGDEKYEQFLKSEVSRLGLKNVHFTGFLSGEEKEKALSLCSVLAMPSEFENLGNVILEGLVRKIPCIATKGSPWEELNIYRCGWWIEYSQEAITATIKEAVSLPADRLQEMGNNGRKLMEMRYSVQAVSKDMLELYSWILGKAPKPSFVFD